MSTRVRAVAVFSVLAAAVALACGDDARSARRMSDSVASLPPSPRSNAKIAIRGDPRFAAGTAGKERVVNDAADAAPTNDAVQPVDTGVTGMIIRNGSASIEVDSLEPAVAAVRAMATSLGGFVGNSSMFTGAQQVRSATLDLKIPAARYDDALNGLKPIGRMETVNSTAEDVGEEFVDLSARMANAKRLEERLIALLETRTGKLSDVVAVERELANVREQIERWQGRIRYLKSRVAMSTLSITVHEPAPLVSNPGTNIIAEAFRNMWRNFVQFVAALISSLGVMIPVAILVLLLALGWRRWARRPPSAGEAPNNQINE